MEKKKGDMPGVFPQSSIGKDALTAMIQQKAFELYVKRGRRDGNALSDWFEAERLVKNQIAMKK